MDDQYTAFRVLYPKNHKSHESRVSLSIVDASVARYSPSAAVFFYQDIPNTASPPHLILSLSKTLEYFPQFAGRLRWSVHDPSRGYNHRFQRLEVVYHSQLDPGVLFETGENNRPLESFLPLLDQSKDVWDTSQAGLDQFFSKTPLVLQCPGPLEGLSCMNVRLTWLASGGNGRGLAIGVQIAHPLADAQALSIFMHAWGDTSRAMLHHEPELAPRVCFVPSMLDARAAGNLCDGEARHDIVTRARALPMHRYDLWESEDEYPWTSAVLKPTGRPNEMLPTPSHGERAPWEELDLSQGCSSYCIHFGREEIETLFQTATSDVAGSTITRHDTLLAHVWMLVNRARQLQDDEAVPVYMDLSLGLRRRVKPPLPDCFMGSPILIAAVAATGKKLSTELSVGEVARLVHQTLARFDEQAIAAWLYDAAFEVAPSRLWQGFLGKRHMLTTSWVNTRLYQVDFFGRRAKHVQAGMPALDGLVQLIEAKPYGEAAEGKWYTSGVDVYVSLEDEAMQRLLEDATLRRFRRGCVGDA